MNVSGTWNSIPFCRLQGSIPYPINNSVLFELWLPDNETYNGRYLSVGNGGFAGTVDTASLFKNLHKGFAVAGSDGGHRQSINDIDNGATSLPFLHDTQQTLAWIRNSIAYFTPSTKAITGMFYANTPEYIYYEGCSTGGAQGFAAAEFHPDLFDGIVASCPGNWYSHLMLSFLWGWKAADQAPLPQSTLDFIRSQVLDACDGLDGLEDGLIENPLACDFNIPSLPCPPDANTTTSEPCLTPSQLRTYTLISSGPIHPVTKKSLYPGFKPGSESDWTGQQGELAQDYAVPLFQNLISQSRSQSARNFTLPTAQSFNWTSHVALVDSEVSPVLDAISTDLSVFKNKGGKLLVTQGWSDPYNAPTWPMEHLARIEEVTSAGEGGQNKEEWMKLFMIPGGGHCGPSPHYPDIPSEVNTLETMINWVEKGISPRDMRASQTSDEDRTRKLCAWPLVARYKDNMTGGRWNWEEFECVDQ
ncbi:putative feruloyl esterase B precursor [Aspergillus steynii IBT 23096]|uniref:Carboxylic ester hydrolase n=1 Tax=Aspergillus steynii IBT 23096 TaxID=1392250 RepID=A0A2I2FZN4_9EURO|nr:putative feruloyl esterase B precursor [Aspergillus steynii IBT 23096]PLB46095.1 putative feruloyl esterase B precursor [Aspergillus steynii IBT 23096]